MLAVKWESGEQVIERVLRESRCHCVDAQMLLVAGFAGGTGLTTVKSCACRDGCADFLMAFQTLRSANDSSSFMAAGALRDALEIRMRF